MTSIPDSQRGADYYHLEADSTGKEECRRWNIYFLILTLILGAETFVASCLLYDFVSDIRATSESLVHGGYPVDCLYQLANPEKPDAPASGGLASCAVMNQELRNSAHKRLLLDIRNSLWQTLGEHNITQSFKPAIQLGVKQGLKQYYHLQKTSKNTGDSEDAPRAIERLWWDSASRLTRQEDGEIEVSQAGLYFVYSHVHFESTPGLDLHFMQYLFKRTALYPRPLLLSKAASSPCLSSQSGVDLYSSQQGALFRLDRGDRLSLYVLNASEVHFPPESTYFGAFMVN